MIWIFNFWKYLYEARVLCVLGLFMLLKGSCNALRCYVQKLWWQAHRSKAPGLALREMGMGDNGSRSQSSWTNATAESKMPSCCHPAESVEVSWPAGVAFPTCSPSECDLTQKSTAFAITFKASRSHVKIRRKLLFGEWKHCLLWPFPFLLLTFPPGEEGKHLHQLPVNGVSHFSGNETRI